MLIVIELHHNKDFSVKNSTYCMHVYTMSHQLDVVTSSYFKLYNVKSDYISKLSYYHINKK